MCAQESRGYAGYHWLVIHRLSTCTLCRLCSSGCVPFLECFQQWNLPLPNTYVINPVTTPFWVEGTVMTYVLQQVKECRYVCVYVRTYTRPHTLLVLFQGLGTRCGYHRCGLRFTHCSNYKRHILHTHAVVYTQHRLALAHHGSTILSSTHTAVNPTRGLQVCKQTDPLMHEISLHEVWIT